MKSQGKHFPFKLNKGNLKRKGFVDIVLIIFKFLLKC